jgi:two-component system, LytTR family, sensor kinase
MIPEFAPPRVPARTVLASIAGLWLCYFVLITFRSFAIDDGFLREMFWRRGLVTFAGIGVTGLAWAILRLVDGRRLGLRIAAAAVIMLPAAGALAVINQRAFAPVEQRINAQHANPVAVGIRHDTSGNILIDIPDPPAISRAQIAAIQKKLDEQGLRRQLTDIAIGRYFLLIAWAALYLALGNAELVRAAERRAGEYRRAAKAAELRSLRYQVNPHFLFNTLNSLSALVMTGKAQAAETMIQTLSTFYRRSLSDDPTGDVSLADEIALQQDYLAIEAARFPTRLRTVFAIPAALEQALVPGMILQPLIENSVKYGVAGTSRTVTITVTAHATDGGLELTVADDAALGQNPPTSGGHGIGLGNVRDRLAARFGDAASLASGPVPGGYRTLIRLPLIAGRG